MKSVLVLVVSFVVLVSIEVNNATTLRGTMINSNLKADDFRVLASWKANHIRWQLNMGEQGGTPINATVAEYEAWLQNALNIFDGMLPVLRQLGLSVLLDLHTPPGGIDKQRRFRLFNETQFQDCFLSSWEMMANRYKNEKQIMGFDILNEPNDTTLATGLLSWRNLAIAVTQRIRAIDPQRTIIVEASPGGHYKTLPNFEPIPFDNIIYSFHMYAPEQFVFQGVLFNVSQPIYYPGMINGKMWNQDQLRATLQPNVDWQKTHNVSIHIGEFSAVRWGNSTAQYLNDVIQLFEEFGWNWNYHCFREFQGWDVEMIGDPYHPQRSPVPTDRQLVLMEWFKKNEL